MSSNASSQLPASLKDWRFSTERSGGERAIWEPLVPFLREHGYELFVPKTSGYRQQIPAPGCSPFRAPDSYHEWVGPPEASRFNPQSAVQVAARSLDGKDVVIRCLTRAGEGHNVVAILDALSSPEALLDPSNHTLPMIEKLEMEDMTFGVIPVMRPNGLTCIWFRTTDEVFRALEAVLEGFVYLHDRLIAHRDFGLAEIFINHGSSYGRMPYDPSRPPSRRPCEWRSLFKSPQYYINDYEWSVQFSPDSSESSMLVQGFPLQAYGITLDEYKRPIPPEVLTGEPYCPFRMDVFQLGTSLHRIFHHMSRVPELVTLLSDMADDDPLKRPTAREAHDRLLEIRASLTEEVLAETPSNGVRFGP